MLPLAVARIVVGKLFEEFHVRGQSDADMRSFDEIMTKQPLLGETSASVFCGRPERHKCLFRDRSLRRKRPDKHQKPPGSRDRSRAHP